MAKIRIRKDNLSGRKEDFIDFNGLLVKVDTENWVEIDNTDLEMYCISPNLYEIEGDRRVFDNKPKEAKPVKPVKPKKEAKK